MTVKMTIYREIFQQAMFDCGRVSKEKEELM